jgi:hypothetical protein
MNCETKIEFEPGFLSFARKCVKLSYENGGNLRINERKKLEPLELTEGKYSSIIIPRALVDFHTHPARCSKNVCALGIPSPSDVKNLVVGTLEGSFCHFVFSKEGIYSLRIGQDLLLFLKQSSCNVLKYLDDIQTIYDKLHNKMMRNKVKYPTYVKYWLDLTRKLGVEVTLFTHKEVPYVLIPHQCGEKIENLKGIKEEIYVEDSSAFIEKNKKKCPQFSKKRKRS